jgi:hypothetical protein
MEQRAMRAAMVVLVAERLEQDLEFGDGARLDRLGA